MEIKQFNRDTKGFFKALEGEETAGVMTYTWAGDKMIIDHTEADPKFKGQGVGLKMVLAAVEYARKENIKIIPLCPFAKSVFDKRDDIKDVLV